MVVLKEDLEMPMAGSGPINGVSEPLLASASAFSFPITPLCPATHSREILLCCDRKQRVWKQSHTNFELMEEAAKALIAAWLSERMRMCTTVSPP
ncbi:hypothetical protein GE061_000133 [Apolygus lucorum]|uniref:Uncharacterized protein n=1 Tax=Apolygus lucorum TaxID=248454 RepID=A0A6A4KMB3_APOLU|nr:hypothetical protein GE061_000133 [Apolygus lucorum]